MPEIGVVYKLGEPDYQFGVGPLVLKVSKVLRETVYDNESWWEVEAMVKHPHNVGPAQPRQLYIRASALPRTSESNSKKPRPEDWSPR
jgi:hypothetical protein